MLLLISFASDGVDRGVFQDEGWALRLPILCLQRRHWMRAIFYHYVTVIQMATRATGRSGWRHDVFVEQIEQP